MYNQLLKCQSLADNHRGQLACPRTLPGVLTVSHVTNSTHHLTFPRHVYGSDLWEIYIGYRHCVPLAAAPPNYRDASIFSWLLMRPRGCWLSLLLDRWSCSQSHSRRPRLVWSMAAIAGSSEMPRARINESAGRVSRLPVPLLLRTSVSSRPGDMCWGE